MDYIGLVINELGINDTLNFIRTCKFLHSFKNLLYKKIPTSTISISQHVRYNNLDYIKQLHLDEQLKYYIMNMACHLNKSEIIIYMFGLVDCSSRCMNYIAKNGNIEVLKYLYERNCLCTEAGIYEAASNNHIEVLKYLLDKTHYDSRRLMYNGIISKKLEIVELLDTHLDLKLDVEIVKYSLHGIMNFDIFNFLYNANYKTDETTKIEAIKHKRIRELEILKVSS